MFPDVTKPLVGMIHLPPLPGAANYEGKAVREIAIEAAHEAVLLKQAGFDAVMMQNTHDRPSRVRVPRGTVAAMAAIGAQIREETDVPLGINVHKNDAEAAFAIAKAVDAPFVRIKVLVGAVVGVEGLIQGASEVALTIQREYAPDVEIWADLYELTSWAFGETTLENIADLATRFGSANRLIVTDPTVDASRDAVARARGATSLPIMIGGRTSAATIKDALEASDGVIVGTSLRRGRRTDQPLDPEAIREFMAVARG